MVRVKPIPRKLGASIARKKKSVPRKKANRTKKPCTYGRSVNTGRCFTRICKYGRDASGSCKPECLEKNKVMPGYYSKAVLPRRW